MNTRILLVFILISLAMSHAAALQINGYDPARHDRFISGYGTDNPQANTNDNFIGKGYDWSGVGWQSDLTNRSVALVSPQHFVAANHHRIPEGSTVSFFGRDNTLHKYTVQKYSTFEYTDQYGTHTPDIVLGWLTEAIPDSDKITHYPVLCAWDSTPSLDTIWYRGKQAYIYGGNAQIGISCISSLSIQNPLWQTQPDNLTKCLECSSAGIIDGASGEGGDSGSPSFMVWDGKLTLIGPHFTAGLGVLDDSFVPDYSNVINLAMNPSGFTLDTIKIDIFPTTLNNAGFEQWDIATMRPAVWTMEKRKNGYLMTSDNYDTTRFRSGTRSFRQREKAYRQGPCWREVITSQTLTNPRIGQLYSFSFWYTNQADGQDDFLVTASTLVIQAGVDPTGGTNPDSLNIIWATHTLTNGNFDSQWHKIAVSAISNGSPMTIFIRRSVSGLLTAEDLTAGRCYFYDTFIDDAEMSVPLLIHYDFEEDFCQPSVSIVTDKSGSGRDITINGTVSRENDAICGSHSIRFDLGGYLERDNLKDDLEQITVSLWFKTLDPTQNYKLASTAWWDCSGAGSGWMLGTHYPELWANDGSSIRTFWQEDVTHYFHSNEWNHIVMSYDKNKNVIKEYINGAKVYEAAGSGQAIGNGSSNGKLQIARWLQFTGFNYDGLMDDFRIYSIALSDDEVQNLYINRGNSYSNVNTAIVVPSNVITKAKSDSYICRNLIEQHIGGSLSLNSENVNADVVVQPDTFNQNAILILSTGSISDYSSDSYIVPNKNLAINIKSDNNQHPDKEITIRIYYKDSDIANIEESNLVICRFDPTSSKLIPIESKVYSDSNKIEVTTNHLGQFTIAAPKVKKNLNNVKIYPNPYNPNKHLAGVTFENLAQDTQIKIYTITGELIKAVDCSANNGTAKWDGTNEANKKVASGVYIALLKTSKETKKLKIAIER